GGDAARVEAVTKVDVRDERRTREPRVGQRVGDRRRAHILVDRGAEGAGRRGGDARRRGLLVAGQCVGRHYRLVAARPAPAGKGANGKRGDRKRGDETADKDEAEQTSTHGFLPPISLTKLVRVLPQHGFPCSDRG